jgi:hypothetical protein
MPVNSKDTTHDTETHVRSVTDKTPTSQAQNTTDPTKTGTSGFSTNTNQSRQQQTVHHDIDIVGDHDSTVFKGGYGTGGRCPSFQKQEVQQKLKEVGQLLQRAGTLLQDLQIGSGESYQSQRGPQGGNYQGPFGGFEAYTGPQRGPWSQQQPSSYQSSYGQGQPPFRGDRNFGGQGGFYAGPEQDRYPTDFYGGSYERFGGSPNRFEGFGGPYRGNFGYGTQEGRGRQDFGRSGEWTDRNQRW